MKFFFNCRELTDILTGLGRIIPRKTSLPVLRHVRMTGGGGNPIQLQATDLDHTATYTVPDTISGKSSAGLILPHKELLKLVRSAKTDRVSLEAADNSDVARITLEGDLGRREHFLPCLDPEEWPEAPETLSVRPADSTFLSQYRRLLPFTSSDPSRTVLQGVSIEPHSQGQVMVATDGRRLCTADGLQLPEGLKGILPRLKLLEWSKLPTEYRVGMEDGRYQIEAGSWSIQGRLIEGTFPNWRQVVPERNKEDQHLKFAELDIPVLEDAVNTLPTGNTTGKDAVEAELHIMERNGAAVLAACDDRSHWQYRPLPNSTISPGEGTAVNRRYLLQAVAAGFLDWRFRGELHPLQATQSGDVHVLMPLRRNAVPPEVMERKSNQPQPESEPQLKKGKVIPMPNPNEQTETEAQPDLLELAQTARDQAKDLTRTLNDLVRQVKVENRANKALQTELGNAKGVLEKLRNIAA